MIESKYARKRRLQMEREAAQTEMAQYQEEHELDVQVGRQIVGRQIVGRIDSAKQPVRQVKTLMVNQNKPIRNGLFGRRK